MGRCKSLSLLKSFLSYASQLSRVFPVFFTFWASFPQGSPYGVAVVPRLLANRYSSPSWVPLGFTSSRWRVAITDDCDILVHWWCDTCVCSLVLTLYNPADCRCQASLSLEFSRQEYWSRLPFPTPGGLRDQGINLLTMCLLHWQADSLPLSHSAGYSISQLSCHLCYFISWLNALYFIQSILF